VTIDDTIGEEVAPMNLATVRMVAERLGVGERQVRLAMARGELPFYQLGHWPRLTWADVNAWLARTRTHHRAPTVRRHGE
jgi:excisionase family DNA binding protein